MDVRRGFRPGGGSSGTGSVGSFLGPPKSITLAGMRYAPTDAVIPWLFGLVGASHHAPSRFAGTSLGFSSNASVAVLLLVLGCDPPHMQDRNQRRPAMVARFTKPMTVSHSTVTGQCFDLVKPRELPWCLWTRVFAPVPLSFLDVFPWRPSHASESGWGHQPRTARWRTQGHGSCDFGSDSGYLSGQRLR